MFVKNLLDKALQKHNENHARKDGAWKKSLEMDLDLQIAVHYGLPYTASTLAFDPIQRLLAIGTLDGRIKIIGGDNIEGLLISPKKVPYKHLEFLQNQGFLVAISNENEIQVWNLEFRQLFYTSQWETNLTAFAVVPGTRFLFLGDENGLFSVLKYDDEDLKIEKMLYHIPLDSLCAKIGIESIESQSIVGILPQPNTYGTRVLIAYEKGLLVLWDITENQPISVRGNLLESSRRSQEDSSSQEDSESEQSICSLCWASATGSVVAVGYITGDIYLWNLVPNHKGKEKEEFVRVQLASGDRRLPVIVLHWSCSVSSTAGSYLFVYGGDDMGSEEVLTVLSIEFANGLENLKLLSRVDLSLNGSFADMILIPDSVSPEKTPTSALFVLTNPGQLNIYDCTIFSKGDNYLQAEKFPVLVPTVDPNITVTKFCTLDENASGNILKKSHGTKGSKLSGGGKWPLTGGVPSEISLSKNRKVQRLFIAGYRDGSVKVWDATFPVLDFMFVLNGKVAGMGIEGADISVSALAFCSISLTLSVGDESGLVRVYKLHEHTEGSSSHSKHEGKGIHCNAAAMVSNSPVRTLNYTKSGLFLSVGFENGQVAMLDISNLSAIFCTEYSPETSSPVVSLLEISSPCVTEKEESPDTVKLPKYPWISLSKAAMVSILNPATGAILSSVKLSDKEELAVSFYIIEGSGKNNESDETKAQGTQNQNQNSNSNLNENLNSGDLKTDKLLLVCCEDVLYLHSLRSIMQGDNKHVKQVKLPQNLCWSGHFRNLDTNSLQLFLIYQTGLLEIRSLPDLEIVSQSSLMSILRWSFKTNMEKTISSFDGQISMVNGSELAIISLLASENAFRIPESLPCLHDKLVASAAEAAINANQKKKQEPGSGILGGIVKGLKGEKGFSSPKFVNTQELEGFFSKSPTCTSSPHNILEEEEKELSIDDIEIDDVVVLEPIKPAPSSSHKNDKKKKPENEREKLFEGSSDVTKPRMRSPQEILTKYKFGGDATAAAAHAKEKLHERQEKLDRLSQKTAELQNGAENFANMAHELARNMEKKNKWWNI